MVFDLSRSTQWSLRSLKARPVRSMALIFWVSDAKERKAQDLCEYLNSWRGIKMDLAEMSSRISFKSKAQLLALKPERIATCSCLNFFSSGRELAGRTRQAWPLIKTIQSKDLKSVMASGESNVIVAERKPS